MKRVKQPLEHTFFLVYVSLHIKAKAGNLRENLWLRRLGESFVVKLLSLNEPLLNSCFHKVKLSPDQAMKLLFWLIFRSFKALHCNRESLQVFYFFEWCIATVSRFTRTLRNKKSSKLVKSLVVKSYSVHFMSTKTCKESAFSNFQNPLFCVKSWLLSFMVFFLRCPVIQQDLYLRKQHISRASKDT